MPNGGDLHHRMMQKMSRFEQRILKEMRREATRPLLSETDVDALLAKVAEHERWQGWRMNILDYVG